MRFSELYTHFGGLLVIYTAYALMFAAAYVVARMFFDEQESRLAQENLADLRNRKSSNILLKLLRPLFSQYVVPMVRGKALWNKRRVIYRRQVIAAGLADELTADEFIAFKFSLVVVFPPIALFMDLDPQYVVGAAILGWFFPNLWIKNRRETRQREVLRAMPFIVDLLALSTEAGLDFVGAISKVVDKARSSPLVDEFAQLLKEIRVGSSRQEGLREMAMRLSMPEVNSFVAILISSDQMGASIGKILRQQSEQIRNQRMLRGEKAGAAAITKLTFVVFIFVVPSIILMIFGPIGISMASGPKL